MKKKNIYLIKIISNLVHDYCQIMFFAEFLHSDPPRPHCLPVSLAYLQSQTKTIQPLSLWQLSQCSTLMYIFIHSRFRYKILKVIGKASFSQVLKVYDHKTHWNFVLKMVRNEKWFHRQAKEEIRILEHLRRGFRYSYQSCPTVSPQI